MRDRELNQRIIEMTDITMAHVISRLHSSHDQLMTLFAAPTAHGKEAAWMKDRREMSVIHERLAQLRTVMTYFETLWKEIKKIEQDKLNA